MRNTLTLCCVLAAGLCASASAKTTNAPAGWHESLDNGARVVTNGVATVRINPWQNLHGQSLDAWLTTLENQPPAGTHFLSSAGVKRETVPGAYSVLRKIAFAEGQEGHSVLYACPGTDGFARLMTLDVQDANFKDTFVGAMFGERVCKKERRLADDDTQRVDAPGANDTSQPTPDQPNGHDTRSGSGTPPGLVELRGVIVMGIQPGGMFGTTDDFIALFEDGTYTEDLGNTFGEGIETSKRKKPKAWGNWRARNDEIELREAGDSAFEKTRGTWRIEPSSPNYRMSGCFGRLNSSSGADYTSGTTVGLARTWCFWRDGRFTNSSTAFGSSSSASMRVTSPKGRGSYHIDGYVARFTYDDGHEVTAAFGYASTKGNHILLNGKRFMGKKH